MKWDHHNPRGPRSCPSYVVSSRHHLIDPIRPTRGHIAIFTAWRLIRDAFAVRERRGDPRVVPGFRYPFCPGIPSSPTPGSSIIVSSSAAMSTRPSPRVDRLGTPKTPAIRFTRAMTFVASWFTHLLRSASLLAPCTDLTGCPASGAFTSGLPAGWSPFPLPDITTTATGLLCWRDSHPLEWQLASLHLLLHRSGLSPHTPCRFLPAHSLALRPAELLNRLKRPLSRGSSPAGYPAEPLVSYQINRQLSGWIFLH